MRAVIIMKGYQFPDGYSLYGRETMVAFRAGKATAPQPVAFEEDRALWRDSLALLQSVEGVNRRPLMVDWLNELMAERVLPVSIVPMDVFGLATDRARIALWRHDRLPVPLAYLAEPELVERLSTAIHLAEKAAVLLNRGARRLAEIVLSPADPRKALRKEVTNVANALAPARSYWPCLDPAFRRLLLDLPDEAGQSLAEGLPSAALGRWAHEVQRAARAAFAGTSRALDGTPRSFKALAEAGGQFARGLAALMKPYREPEEAYAGAE